MKKILISAFLTIFVLAGAMANSNSLFTTEVSLGTGISIYDTSSDTLRKELLSQKDYKRVIAGLTLDTNLNISDPLKIMFGAEAFSDFLWLKPDYYNTLDYAFFTGIKVFPNKTGLNFSISYVLGNRSDFYTEQVKTPTGELDGEGNPVVDENGDPATKNVLKKQNDTKAWGNGFRISIQYDFMLNKKSTVKPIIGGYYRCVPRGDYNRDHILSIYGGIRF
jgi:hypothetical protein